MLCLLAPSRGRVLRLRGNPVRGANPRRPVFTFTALALRTRTPGARALYARWHLHAAQGAPVACAAGHNEMLGPALMAVEATVVRVYCPAAFDGAVGTCAHIEVTPESS